MISDEKELAETIVKAIELQLTPLQVRISTLEHNVDVLTKALDLLSETFVEPIIKMISMKNPEGRVN